MREALFQPDPLTALIDTWVLCYQMADYFETVARIGCDGLNDDSLAVPGQLFVQIDFFAVDLRRERLLERVAIECLDRICNRCRGRYTALSFAKFYVYLAHI